MTTRSCREHALALSVLLIAGAASGGVARPTAKDLNHVRGKVEEEVRMAGFRVVTPAERVLRERIEWHAGHLMWSWERSGRKGGLDGFGLTVAPPGALNGNGGKVDELCRVLDVLGLAYWTLGQRFYQSTRVLAAVESALAACQQEIISGSGRWRNGAARDMSKPVCETFLRTLYGFGAGLRVSRRKYLRIAVERSIASEGGMDLPSRIWRARMTVLWAAWRKDLGAASAAFEGAAAALRFWGASETITRADTLLEDLLVAREAYALRRIAGSTAFVPPPASLAKAVRSVESVHRWLWAGATFDPLVIRDLTRKAWQLNWLTDAAFEVAIQIVAGSEDERQGWAEGLLRTTDERRTWESAAPKPPGRRALRAARMWRTARTADAVMSRPMIVKTDRALRLFPISGFGVGRLERGRASLLLPGTSPPSARTSMTYCTYEGPRVLPLTRGGAGLWRPGVVTSGDLGKGRRRITSEVTGVGLVALKDDVLAGMQTFMLRRGVARIDVRRMCGLFAGGLFMTVGGFRASGPMTVVHPWQNARGRDDRAWIEFDFARGRSFDTVLVHFALGGRSWAGLPPRTDIRISDDRVAWTLVRQEVNAYGDNERPPEVRSVTYRLPPVQGRYLRLSFPLGGIGGTIRIVEVEVRSTRAKGDGSVDLASVSEGCRVSAESAASPEASPGRAIDGIIRGWPTAPGAAHWVLGYVPAKSKLLIGFENHPPEERVAPLYVKEEEIGGVRWLWDGQSGYVFAAPTSVGLRNLGKGLLGFSVKLGSVPAGVVVFPQCDREALEKALDPERFRWRVLSDQAIWIHDSLRAVGLIAAFAETRGAGYECDGACLIGYRVENRLLRVAASGVGGKRRVGLSLDNVVEAEVNGKRVKRGLEDPLIRFEAPMR